MSEKYRAGVIGCGVIGSFIEDTMNNSARFSLPNGHAACYDSMHEINLVGGSDISLERRIAFSKRWNLPEKQVYADYTKFLDEQKLDIVSIATPSPHHTTPTLDSINAGIRAIFLEKPIASNIAEAKKIIYESDKNNVSLAINHTRRGDYAYRVAKKLIDDGSIGELHTMIAHFSGALMFIGSHAVDILNYFVGDCPVKWMTGHLDKEPDFDPGGNAYILYENGVRAFVNGTTGHALGFKIEVIGSEGEIIIGNHDLQFWRTNTEGGSRTLVQHPFPQVYTAISPMVALIQELIVASKGGPAPISNGPTALEALKIIVGLHISSSKDSSPVTLNELDENFDIPSL